MESQIIRVLLVDDDLGDFEMTRAILSQAEHGNFKLDWVSSSQEALDAFKTREHDVYLLDYFLEDRTGLDLLKEATQLGIDAPVIMLTGKGSRDVDVEAMGAGAADYLVKGRIDPETLERSIRYALERNRAARALKESEERHRSMFDHLPVGLYRSDADGTFLDANPALIRILGYPDRESLQRIYSSVFYVDPDDSQRFGALLDKYGVVRGFESTLRHLNGASIKVRNNARLHRDPDGEVMYLEGTLEDISEEQFSKDLHGSDARFRAVFDGTRTGIALLDMNGLVLEANASFADIFLTTPRDLEGTRYIDRLVEDDQPAVTRELTALANGEDSRLGAERRFRNQDGSVIWARASMSLVRNQDGEPEQLVVLLDDVSDGDGGL